MCIFLENREGNVIKRLYVNIMSLTCTVCNTCKHKKSFDHSVNTATRMTTTEPVRKRWKGRERKSRNEWKREIRKWVWRMDKRKKKRKKNNREGSNMKKSLWLGWCFSCLPLHTYRYLSRPWRSSTRLLICLVISFISSVNTSWRHEHVIYSLTFSLSTTPPATNTTPISVTSHPCDT